MFIKKSLKKDFLLLGLITLSLILILFGVNIYALDEFIDDYENENNIAIKNDVIRNAIYNAMELNTSLVDPIIENFTTYWVQDEDNDFTINSTTVYYTTLRKDANASVYRELGIGYFGDFYHNFTFILNDLEAGDATGGDVFCPYILSNLNLSWGEILNLGADPDADYINVILKQEGANDDLFRWKIQQRTNGINIVNIQEPLGTNNPLGTYYCSILRNGTLIKLIIWTDSTRTVINKTLSSVAGNTTSYRYVGIANRHSVGDPADHLTGATKNLMLGNYTLGFTNNGYFYTTEVLSPLSNSTVVLLTNYTSNTGNITVEFSNDNSTWLDHNGNVGSDTLIDGLESIDLGDLNYTQLYMRYNFTRGGDVGTTPRLYQIRVITNDVILAGAIGFIIASFILVPIILVFMWRRKRR